MAKVVTIINPVTGQPVQVDQLDHTAQQIDDAVEAARWSHRNLLDNAYFANPDAIIDQRGGYVVPPGKLVYQTLWENPHEATKYLPVTYIDHSRNYAEVNEDGTTYYIGAEDCVRGYVGVGYGLDRWRTFDVDSAVSVTFEENGVNIKSPSSAGHWAQTLEHTILDNIPVTASILSNGNLYTISGTGNIEFDGIGSFGAKFYYQRNTNRFGFYFVAGASFSVSAAKLELGTVQTLAHRDENGNWVLNDPPPDKALELAKCQYYYRECYINAWIPKARDTESPKYSMTVNFQKMRTAPAVTLYDGNGNRITSQPSVAVSYPESFTVVSDVETVLFKYVLNSDL